MRLNKQNVAERSEAVTQNQTQIRKGESKDLRAEFFILFFFKKIMLYVRFEDVGSAAHTAWAGE